MTHCIVDEPDFKMYLLRAQRGARVIVPSKGSKIMSMETMYVLIGTVDGRHGPNPGVVDVSLSTSAEESMTWFRSKFLAGTVYACRLSESGFLAVKALVDAGKGQEALARLKSYSHSMQQYLAVT